MRIGVTGSEGLIGWHLGCHIKTQPDLALKRGMRADFANEEALRRFVSDCDAIVHLAGMNRGEDSVVAATNIRLAEQLAGALKAEGKKIPVAFSNSTHVDRGTPYGESKKKAAAILRDWAESSGGRFINLILPHVFGEHGKPFYNSAVSTFCHQLAIGETPQIQVDTELELVHGLEVSREFVAKIREGFHGEYRMSGRKIRVSAVLEKLRGFHASYVGQGVVPDVRDRFDLLLFNTLRSYLYPTSYPVDLVLRTDARGSLFEAEKDLNGGQCFVSTTKPGITRGNHFHQYKIERFCVVQGEARIQIRKLFSKEVRDFVVSGSKPQYIDMPTLHTHNITNIGQGELVTLFWSHEIFDPSQPDTVAEPMEGAH